MNKRRRCITREYNKHGESMQMSQNRLPIVVLSLVRLYTVPFPQRVLWYNTIPVCISNNPTKAAVAIITITTTTTNSDDDPTIMCPHTS